MPDPSVRRDLATEGGYTRIPERVLLSGLPDLGVMTWVLLRLWADDSWVPASYRKFADQLGMRDVPTKAVEKRFVRVIPAMIEAGLLERRREPDNQIYYRAMTPSGGRYAILRRGYDLPLLDSGVLHPRTGKQLQVTVSHLVDFARWQLEAGRRGWTTATTVTLAARWGVSARTVEMRRDSLAATGLLQLTRRSGYSDLVWLGELYDPHWLVPSRMVDHVAVNSDTPSAGVAGNGGLPTGTLAETGGYTGAGSGGYSVAEFGRLGVAENGGRPSQNLGTSNKEVLTEVLAENCLTDLGGASATPLSFVTHEPSDAEPQAALRSTTRSELRERDRRLFPSRLLASQPRLAVAEPRWRSGMLATIGRALDQGLDPGQLAHALQRVVEAGEVEAHCEIVRVAVKEAWADQRAGMCAECGADPGQHLVGCPSRAAEADAAGEDEVEIRRLIVASLAEAQLAAAGGQWAERAPDARVEVESVLDPLQPYLDLAVALKGVVLEVDAAPEVVAEWLTGQIASRLVDVDDLSGRRRALDRSVAWWTRQLPPEQHQAVELAAAQLRDALAITGRRAS